MTSSNADTLIVDVVARLDERSFRQIQQDAERAGQQSGGAFGGGLTQGAQQGAQDASRAVENGLQGAEQAAEQGGQRAGGKLAGAFQGALAALPALAAGAALAVGAAAVGGVLAVTNMAAESAQNVNEFQAQLGVTVAEAERLGKVAEGVFGDNWTGSLSEAAAAVTDVRREIKGLAESELQSVTGAVVGIAETFGEENARVAAAVQSVMDTTGVSAKEATDLIARGFQTGLNSSGDFLDTLNEYAPQFKAAGLNAGELYSLLETGAAKGALGIDKVADTMAEFRKITQAGGEDVVTAFNDLGLNGDKIVKQISSGQITIAEAFQLANTKLTGVTDTVKQQQIGVALMGTLYEDLGQKAVAGIDLNKTSLKDLAGGVDAVNTRYTSFRDVFTGVWRQVQVALLPVGKELLGLANEAVPAVKAALSQVTPIVTQVVRFLVDGFRQGRAAGQQFADTFGPQIERALVTFRPVLQAIGPLFAATFGLIRQLWETVLRPVLTAIAPLVSGVVATVGNTLNLIVRVVTGVVNAVSALFRGDLGGAVKALEGIFADGVTFVVRQVRNMASTMLGLIRNLAPQMADAAADILRGLIRGIESGAGNVVAAARNMAGGIIDGIRSKLKIQSPSREMFVAGEYVGEGLAGGITKSTPAVQKAAAGMADTVISEVAKARAELEKQIKYDAWVKSLATVDDSLLIVEATLARSLGQGDRYNAILAEQARRTQAVADATAAAAQETSDLAAAQIAASNAAAQRDPQGATDAAFRQSFGAGDVGLIRSLAAVTGLSVAAIRADVNGALDDAKRFAPEAAAIIERVWAANLTQRREAAAEEIRLNGEINASYEQQSRDRIALIQKQADEESQAGVTSESLLGILDELLALGRDPRQSGFTDWLDELATGQGAAADAARTLKRDIESVIAARTLALGVADPGVEFGAGGPVAARGTRAPIVEPVPVEALRSHQTFNETTARGVRLLTDEEVAWRTRTTAQNEALRLQNEYRATLAGLTVTQLEAAAAQALQNGQAERYAVLQAEILRLTKEQTDADKAAREETARKAALELNGKNLAKSFGQGRETGDENGAKAVLGVTSALGALTSPLYLFGEILQKINPAGAILEGLFSVLAEPIKAIQEPLKLFGTLLGSLIAPVLQLLAPVLRLVVNALVFMYDALAALVKAVTLGFVDISRKEAAPTAAPAPAAPKATAPATASGNNVVQIPSSQVTVLASPSWVPKMEAVADKMLVAGEYMAELARDGIRIRNDTPAPISNPGFTGAFALAWDLRT